MHEITLATQTTFAELFQRSLDAEFDDAYRKRGALQTPPEERWLLLVLPMGRGRQKERALRRAGHRAVTCPNPGYAYDSD